MRAHELTRYSNFLKLHGVSAERLLSEAGIPSVVLEHPRALVAQSRACRFGELACQALSTEHLGLHLAAGEAVDDIPVYGNLMANAGTVGDYLIRGSRLFRIQSSAVKFEWNLHGHMFRLYRRHVLEQGLAAYQSDLQAFVLTVHRLRQALGPSWCPEVVCFAYTPRETMPRVDVFGNARILHGGEAPYLEFPSRLLGTRFPQSRSADDPNLPAAAIDSEKIPSLSRRLVEVQLRNLLPGTDMSIATVAASLGLSPRSLQRQLLNQGISYRELVAQVRFDRACDWLSETQSSVAEIAYNLGYADPANFTRAFRARAGTAPQKFRKNLAGAAAKQPAGLSA